jgi:hypothetical protein
MLRADFEGEYKVKSDRIRAIILVAGLYDARPVVDLYVNATMKMTPEEAAGLSPVLWDKVAENKKNIQILMAYGTADSPAFNQSNELFYSVFYKFEFLFIYLLKIILI